MSSDEECASGKAFEGGSDLDTEVEELFGDKEGLETIPRVEITDHEIDQLFGDRVQGEQSRGEVAQHENRGSEEAGEVARDDQSGEEVAVGPLPSGEADNRWSTWDTASDWDRNYLNLFSEDALRECGLFLDYASLLPSLSRKGKEFTIEEPTA